MVSEFIDIFVKFSSFISRGWGFWLPVLSRWEGFCTQWLSRGGEGFCPLQVVSRGFVPERGWFQMKLIPALEHNKNNITSCILNLIQNLINTWPESKKQPDTNNLATHPKVQQTTSSQWQKVMPPTTLSHLPSHIGKHKYHRVVISQNHPQSATDKPAHLSAHKPSHHTKSSPPKPMKIPDQVKKSTIYNFTKIIRLL